MSINKKSMRALEIRRKNLRSTMIKELRSRVFLKCCSFDQLCQLWSVDRKEMKDMREIPDIWKFIELKRNELCCLSQLKAKTEQVKKIRDKNVDFFCFELGVSDIVNDIVTLENGNGVNKASNDHKEESEKQGIETHSVNKVNKDKKPQLPIFHDYAYSPNNINNLQYQSKITNAQIIPHLGFWVYLKQCIAKAEISHARLWQFLSHFLRMNTNQQISLINSEYQLAILSTIQSFVLTLSNSSHLQCYQTLLKWVKTKQCLSLINAMTIKFLHPCECEYRNIYVIIKDCLYSQFLSPDSLRVLCEIMQRILKNADYEELYQIYVRECGIAIGLANWAMMMLNVNAKGEGEVEVIVSIGVTIGMLMDGYPRLRIEYGKMGVALLASTLIVDGRQQCILSGLSLLHALSLANQSFYNVFIDVQLQKIGLWRTLLQSPKILHHSKIEIRRSAWQLIVSVFQHGESLTQARMMEKFDMPETRDILDYIETVIWNHAETDNQLLVSLFKVIGFILEYGDRNRREGNINYSLQVVLARNVNGLLKRYETNENEHVANQASRVVQLIKLYINKLFSGQ